MEEEENVCWLQLFKACSVFRVFVWDGDYSDWFQSRNPCCLPSLRVDRLIKFLHAFSLRHMVC